MKLTCFHIFYMNLRLKLVPSGIHEHVLNNQEHVKNAYEQHSSISSTFKEFK